MSSSSASTPGTPSPSYWPAPALIVGVHGVLQLHPQVAWHVERDTFEHDVYSMMVERGVALGLAEFGLGGREPSVPVRWHQHEADGDWTQDGRVRQVAWLQAEPANLPHQPLPVWLMVACLDDVVAKLGTFTPVGLHALLPLHLDVPANVSGYVGSTFTWFDKEHHDEDESRPLHEFTVSLHITAGEDEGFDAAALIAAMRERASIALGVEPLSGQSPAAIPEPDDLEGRWVLGANLASLHLRCRAHEWSLDVAAFTTNVIVDAARDVGIDQPLMVSIFHTKAEGAE